MTPISIPQKAAGPRAPMALLRIAVAFVAGVWLGYFAIEFVGGMLAAVGIPQAYFQFFGRAHLQLGLALLTLFNWAVPVALLVCGGVLALRALVGRGAFVLPAALAGLLAWYVHARLTFQVPSLEASVVHPVSLLAKLWWPFTAPWWSLSVSLAPWAGFALAIWLIVRAERASNRSAG